MTGCSPLVEPEPEPEPEPDSGRNFVDARADSLDMNEFEHERLDVYKAAIELLVLADSVAAMLPRGRGYLADQLRRAASSISFNIAEGAGEFASDEKARFYRLARRSATESAAILDACRALSLTDNSEIGRSVLLRIVAMLTAIVKRSGSGSGSGSGRER